MKALKIIIIVAIAFLFYHCRAAKFEEKPPFTITSAVYNNWSGGQPGEKGSILNITYTSNYVIKFDSVYFLKKIQKLEMVKTKDKKMITANFITSPKKDIILDANTSKEMLNTIPEFKKLPFDLNQNDAVISYSVKGKTKHYKIKAIKKGKSIFYPSAPKQE